MPISLAIRRNVRLERKVVLTLRHGTDTIMPPARVAKFASSSDNRRRNFFTLRTWNVVDIHLRRPFAVRRIVSSSGVICISQIGLDDRAGMRPCVQCADAGIVAVYLVDFPPMMAS